MLPSMQSLAIGGIDTDTGKSIATGLLARYLLQHHKKVCTLKLVQTGCDGISDDIRLHRQLMGQELSEQDRQGLTCPYIFSFPASPLLAAKLAGQQIEEEVLNNALNTLRQQFEWVLVEGAGGLLVPLNEHLLLLDYFAKLRLPLVLVTSPRLGSINHTRLSLEAIRARGIELLGLVYNLHGNHPPEIVQDTLHECKKALGDYGFAPRVVLLPDMKESTAVAWNTILPLAEVQSVQTNPE